MLRDTEYCTVSSIASGTAVITKGYKLPAQYIMSLIESCEVSERPAYRGRSSLSLNDILDSMSLDTGSEQFTMDNGLNLNQRITSLVRDVNEIPKGVEDYHMQISYPEGPFRTTSGVYGMVRIWNKRTESRWTVEYLHEFHEPISEDTFKNITDDLKIEGPELEEVGTPIDFAEIKKAIAGMLSGWYRDLPLAFNVSVAELFSQYPVIEPIEFSLDGDEVFGKAAVTVGSITEERDVYVKIPDQMFYMANSWDAVIALSQNMRIPRPKERDRMLDLYFDFFQTIISVLMTDILFQDLQR